MSFWANVFCANLLWANVHLGKCLSGQMSSRHMSSGQMSFGASFSKQMSLSKCRMGKCRMGKCRVTSMIDFSHNLYSFPLSPLPYLMYMHCLLPYLTRDTFTGEWCMSLSLYLWDRIRLQSLDPPLDRHKTNVRNERYKRKKDPICLASNREKEGISNESFVFAID
jgi:hypothetical protein